MSDYKLDVNGIITLSDYGDIYDYIDIVGENDKFTITLEHKDKENIELIISVLEYKDFIVTNSGINKEGRYCIKAHRNSKLTNIT